MRELEDLARLQPEFSPRGVRFVALCDGKDFDQIRDLARSLKVEFPVYYNASEQKPFGELGAFSPVPVTWILGFGGNMMRLEGRRDALELRRLLEERLGGS